MNPNTTASWQKCSAVESAVVTLIGIILVPKGETQLHFVVSQNETAQYKVMYWSIQHRNICHAMSKEVDGLCL